MQIVLLERVERLGQMGDVVTVRPGYARNYLLPQKKALRATKENLSYFETQKAILETTNLKRRDEAQSVALKMVDVMVTVIRQASDNGHLYGSVRSQDISEALMASSYCVNRTQVEILVPIKELGIHQARVVLHPEVSVLVKVNVAKTQEEAEVQAGKVVKTQEETSQDA
ncbi:MAG TPA: 50S ribosomal protein L9 [Alphaproteobacteria bacterium]|nr:50S ribosomal protein L9 [Alphaproteobacteria bacterium]